ncbi:MAG: hypothetical protein H0V17_13465 [Deltaproteobacteria bacterium]|nr:hypothetical protein [Deltaproteobacteria bacterium]
MKWAASMLFLIACGQPGGVGPQSDAPGASDAPPSDPSMLPTWRLEDVQPDSPRLGEVYGVDTFAGKIIVVSLLEGF